MESWSRWSKALAWKVSIRQKRIMGSKSHTLRQRIFKYGCNFAVLDGEVAVPCNLQSAIAGLNSI